MIHTATARLGVFAFLKAPLPCPCVWITLDPAVACRGAVRGLALLTGPVSRAHARRRPSRANTYPFRSAHAHAPLLSLGLFRFSAVARSAIALYLAACSSVMLAG